MLLNDWCCFFVYIIYHWCTAHYTIYTDIVNHILTIWNSPESVRPILWTSDYVDMFYLVSKYFTFLPSINNIGLFYHFFNDYCTISRLFHKLCTTGKQTIYVNIWTCSLYHQSYLFNVTAIHFIIIQMLNVCLFCKFKH